MADFYKNAYIDGVKTDIKTENGKITGIGRYDEDGTDQGGCCVYPGLVDIHSHGCIGYDTMDGKYLTEMFIRSIRWLPMKAGALPPNPSPRRQENFHRIPPTRYSRLRFMTRQLPATAMPMWNCAKFPCLTA